ncbi:hypothetical protein JW930_01265 [Candidatus Woesearchaeota archaeon]|nr:hypothetical protein [Candidatus Woesearchaeota archaeon]
MPPIHQSLTKLFGIELEFFLLDNEGNIVNSADTILNKKKEFLDTELKQECGKSMLELTSFPHLSSRHVFDCFFQDFETLLYEVDKEELRLFYYGTYPGRNNTEMREEKRYSAKKAILGEKNFENAGRCIGFHYHHSLPRKSYNHKIKFFYPDIHKRNTEKVLNIYNLFIAADPAITALMQSSPFVEGKYLGKDSRVIMYRGDKVFSAPDSLYSNEPEFGTLNNYGQDFKSLTEEIRQRFTKWKSLLKRHGYSYSDFIKKKSSILDSSWKPVKISSHGTIELRGADMNSPSKVVGLSILMNSITKHISENFIKVLPSEIGNNEPFKIEGDKIYVPNADCLTKILQERSANQGLEDKTVRDYCKALLMVAKKERTNTKNDIVKIFSNMIEEEKTSSDKILEMVRKKEGSTDNISQDTARRISIKMADNLFKDLLITKKISEQILY